MNEKAQIELLSKKTEITDLIVRQAKTIGPIESIGEEQDKYDYEDGLKHSRNYFSGGFFLKFKILDHLKSRGQINHDSAYALYERLMKEIYNRIKARDAIKTTLDNYLLEEDYTFGIKLISDELIRSYKTYKFILITNFIKLENVPLVVIGKTTIRGIDNDYLRDWPTTIENRSYVNFYDSSLSKEKFLERNKNLVALETVVNGFHFADEKSVPFYAAINNFEQAFAFLYFSKYYAFNIAMEYVMRTEKTNELSRGLLRNQPIQTFYVSFSESNEDILKCIKLYKDDLVHLTDDIFTIDAQALEHLNSLCLLNNYSASVSEKKEIGEKVTRCLDWWLKSTLEKDLTDQALSLFISLESLLSMDSQPLTSHTDDMAENIAIMSESNSEKRYLKKSEFKKTIYPLRNKIMHHGYKCLEDRDDDSVNLVKDCVAISLKGILQRLEEISKYGSDAKAMREYFEREKLKSQDE